MTKMFSPGKTQTEKNTYFGIIFLLIFAIAWLIYPILAGSTGLVAFALCLLVMEFLLLIWSFFRWRTLPGGSLLTDSTVNRRFNFIFGAESASIVLAVFICNALHAPDAISEVIAMVVGAHFIPLATAFRLRSYRLLGVLLIVTGALCLGAVIIRPTSVGVHMAIDYAASFCLFSTAVLNILKPRRWSV